jgi:transcriptional regulator of acetoin/glycerol metabolism
MRFLWDPSLSMKDVQIFATLCALRWSRGNKKLAAEKLKIDRVTLYKWINADDRLKEFRPGETGPNDIEIRSK